MAESKSKKRIRFPMCGAPRGGADVEEVRKANARMPKGMVGLNPYRFSTIEISEQTMYVLSVFALRYSMGGGTIGTSGAIGDVISDVGFSDLAYRIAGVIVPEYESYCERFEHKPKHDSEWWRGYLWLKALRDNDFYLVKSEGNGERRETLCFNCDGEWHDAVFFVQNQSVRCHAAPEYIKSVERCDWRKFVEERRGEAERKAAKESEARLKAKRRKGVAAK